MGRVFDLLGNYDSYNEDITPAEADASALYSDWASVGDHIVSATQELSSDVRK